MMAVGRGAQVAVTARIQGLGASFLSVTPDLEQLGRAFFFGESDNYLVKTSRHSLYKLEESLLCGKKVLCSKDLSNCTAEPECSLRYVYDNVYAE